MSEKDQETPEPQETPGGDEASAPEAGQATGESEDAAERLAALEAEVAEHKNRLLREMADMENLRKRTQREKEDAARFAISRFAHDIISVSDDLARAIEAVPVDARSGGDGIVANLIAGIELTERRLQQVFERHGVRRFDPAGEKFDPMVHEAMFEMPDPSKPAGTVAQVVEVGYMIGERVLRPARVGVSTGGPKAEPEAEPAASGASQAQQAPGEAQGAQAAQEIGREQVAGAQRTPPQPGQPEPPQPDQIGIKIDRSA